MGVTPNPVERYTDNEPETDALSLHTNPAEGRSRIAEETLAVPPPYSDSENIDYGIADGVPVNVNAQPYVGQTHTSKNGSVCLSDALYDADPAYLEAAVQQWAAVPPVKTIDIKGTHTHTKSTGKNKTEKETVVDFHVRLRLTEYLFTHPGRSAWRELDLVENGAKAHRGTVFKIKGERIAADLERCKPSLKEWCHRYCANHSKVKTFKMARVVTGLDEDYLTEQLTKLVQNTNYRGHLSVTFPIENPNVEVYSDHRVNRWRQNTWIYLLFLITFLWIFAWPVLFFWTKKYSVVKSAWPFSKEDEHGRRVYATMSEKQWYNRWAGAIERAVLGKRQDVLTEEDLAAENQPPAVVNSGNRVVDQAIGLLGAGVRAYQEVNRQVGWGYDD